MKKKAIIAVILGLVCALVGCQAQPAEVTPTPAPSVSVTPAPTPTPTPTPSPEPTPTQWPTAEDIFPREFYFMSGVGGWCTELHVATDGSFSGYYHTSVYGGEDGNEWTVYFCDFTGRFSTPEKVNEYTYSVKLEELVKEPAEKTITEDGVFIPDDIAVGIEGGEGFLIYLPGAPLDELPEEFLLWVTAPMMVTDEDTTLPYYGLYNVEEQTGFFD